MITNIEILTKATKLIFYILASFAVFNVINFMFRNYATMTDQILIPLGYQIAGIIVNTYEEAVIKIVIIIVTTVFYSRSFYALNEKIEELPSRFSDGRTASDTIYPWFITKWIADEFNAFKSNKNSTAKHQALFILSIATAISFISYFSLLSTIALQFILNNKDIFSYFYNVIF